MVERKKKIIAKRQMLHAYKLKFYHPITGELLNIIAPLDESFKKILYKTNLKLDESKL